MRRSLFASLAFACATATAGAQANYEIPAPTQPPLSPGFVSIATQVLPQQQAPVRLDRCSAAAPRNNKFVTTALALTNNSNRRIHIIDLEFVFYDTAGKRTSDHALLPANADVDAAINASIQMSTAGTPYAKIYCAIRRVDYADRSRWNAGAGFLAGATPP